MKSFLAIFFILVLATFAYAANWDMANTWSGVQTLTGNMVLSGTQDTTISTASTTITIDSPSASTIIYDFTNSGAGVAQVKTDSIVLTPSAAPTDSFDDSDDAGTVDGSIIVNCPTTNDCDMTISLDSGSDTEVAVLKFDTNDSGETVLQFITHAAAPAACAIGDFYIDTSGGTCWCTSTNTWTNAHAVGACT